MRDELDSKAADNEVRSAVARVLDQVEPEPGRAGIKGTPARVAKMWLHELTAGYDIDVSRLFRTFDHEGYDGMITMPNIPVTSTCEHHLMPIVGYAHIGYFPDGKVIGLSKLPRVVNAFARRLQLQERLTDQIVDAIEKYLEPRGVIVVIQAEHHCMTMRGVQAPGIITTTSKATGLFIEEQGTKDEFLRLIGNNHG